MVSLNKVCPNYFISQINQLLFIIWYNYSFEIPKMINNNCCIWTWRKRSSVSFDMLVVFCSPKSDSTEVTIKYFFLEYLKIHFKLINKKTKLYFKKKSWLFKYQPSLNICASVYVLNTIKYQKAFIKINHTIWGTYGW